MGRILCPTSLVQANLTTNKTKKMELQQQQDNDKLRVVSELEPPKEVGEWTLAQIKKALSRKLPDNILKTLPGKGNAKYLSWHSVVRILDKYAPGWQWEVRQIYTTPERVFLVGRLTIIAKDGHFFQDATGTELLKNGDKEIAYGDPTSNAESMALRRAATRYGLALYLYDR